MICELAELNLFLVWCCHQVKCVYNFISLLFQIMPRLSTASFTSAVSDLSALLPWWVWDKLLVWIENKVYTYSLSCLYLPWSEEICTRGEEWMSRGYYLKSCHFIMKKRLEPNNDGSFEIAPHTISRPALSNITEDGRIGSL